MKNVVAVVLGGGRGSRLMPLTQKRSKPAVPLAGKYRLIDIPISNCINSGLHHVYVLTQFMSVSLHRHIRGAYRFDAFSSGFVEILAAQQTIDADAERDWYQGTADAVRKSMRYFLQEKFDYVLILSGDQLYRMDYRKMLADHERANADVTIAAKPFNRKDATGLGLMKADDTGRVTGFVEKPKTEEALAAAAIDPAWIDKQGIVSGGRDCLANMGMYLFSRDAILDLLENTKHEDFGNEVFPSCINDKRVQLHLFDDYWEDIGTIRAFYEANLEMAKRDATFPLAVADAPIFTRARFLPSARVDGAKITGSLIADGCVIEPGAEIENSVIGLRTWIGPNVKIRNSILMGADYLEAPDKLSADAAEGKPRVGIGAGSVIDGAIVDKNCRVGENVQIVNAGGIKDGEGDQGCVISDGIVVVPKTTTLPAGWKI